MKDKNVMEVPPDFNWKIYLELNPDICRFPNYTTQQGSISHWKQYGRKEGRSYKRNQIPETTKPAIEKKVVECKKNKVVYTCISGNYDTIKDIEVIDPTFDYICFSDSEKLVSKTWTIRKIPSFLIGLDNTRIARCIKVLPHYFLSEYDISVWVDGNIQVVGSMEEFINNNITDKNIFIPKHPLRLSIYDESVAVLKLKKDDEVVVKRQIKKYRKEEYPDNDGLCQSNVIIRRHNNTDIISFGEQWWNEILFHSKRDQLSFNYISWKNNHIEIGILNPNIISSKYFKYWSHHGERAKEKKLPLGYGDIINYVNGKEV
jgi:hypothetical protein